MEGKIRNAIRRAKGMLTAEQWMQNLVQYWDEHWHHPSGILHPTHKSPEEKRLSRNRKARRRRKRK